MVITVVSKAKDNCTFEQVQPQMGGQLLETALHFLSECNGFAALKYLSFGTEWLFGLPRPAGPFKFYQDVQPVQVELSMMVKGD